VSEAESGPWLDALLRRPQQLEQLPPCRSGCPSGTDVRRWLGFVAQRERLGLSLEEALERAFYEVVSRNPFPAVMGRICPHPCEDGCNREGKDGAVAIHSLERYLGDWAIDSRLPLRRLDEGPHTESVAVVGAGPAGLSFAYQMARRGYRVRVHERGERPGGMLLRGIPEYRLPERILFAEIDRILELGVELFLNSSIGSDRSFAELRRQHDVVFLGVGAQSGRLLGIPGELGDGVLTGVDYLREYNRGMPPDLGARVAIVGGGNTAIDAARAARRTGAEVTLVYRRGRDEMPAIAAEVDEALDEGVRLVTLAAPLEVVRTNGTIHALRLARMRLAEPDASGRRRPVAIPGEEFELALDGIVAAVSQEPDWHGMENLRSSDGWAGSDELVAGVWTGGDARGLGIASLAIAQGRLAAESVHARLRGLEPPAPIAGSPIDASHVRLDRYASRPRLESKPRPVADRLAEPELEVHAGISDETFVAEAQRCLSCGSCFGCQSCAMFCNPAGFTRLAEVGPGAYFAWNLDACEGCGKCIEVCPCGFLSAR